jgi:ribonuclease J
VAVVSLVLSRRGEVLGEPGLVLEGVPLADSDGESMREIVFDAIDGTLRSIPPKRRSDTAMVQEAVQRAVRSAINEVWGKKPVVKVLLSVVEARG